MTWRLTSRSGSTTEVLQNPLISHNHPESLIDRRHISLSSRIVHASSKILIWFALVFDSEWYWLTEGASILNVLSQKFCWNMQTFEGSIKQQIQVTYNKIIKSNEMLKKKGSLQNVSTLTLSKILLIMPHSPAKANSPVLASYGLCCPEPTLSLWITLHLNPKLLLYVIVRIALCQPHAWVNKRRYCQTLNIIQNNVDAKSELYLCDHDVIKLMNCIRKVNFKLRFWHILSKMLVKQR